MHTCHLIIFAGDHGMAQAGVSAFPQEVTRQMVLNFLSGGAAANVFAKTVGVSLQVVDSGIVGKPISHQNLTSKSIAFGTNNAITTPAMSSVERDQALTIGEAMGTKSDTDAICFGEMGIGNTSSATLLAHKILGLPLDRLIGRGTGLDTEGLARKYKLLQSASTRTTQKLSALEAACEYGGFEIVMMAGAMIGAAKANKIVIVDGFIATSAALIALTIHPSIQGAFVYAHMSEEHGHHALLNALHAKPLLNLGMRLGEGTGALLAWPLIKAAADMLNNMASFDSANVSGKL